MPGYLIIAIVCTGLWLLFPKGFKYLVGTLIGLIGAAFVWGLGVLVWTVALGNDISWQAMAWCFIACVIAGTASGCVLAAKG